MVEEKTFVLADYLVFCAVLIVCVLIGLVQGIRDRWGIKNPVKPGEEKNMALLPVIWSIVATSFSSNFVLGFPAEIYYIGSAFGVCCIGFAIGIPTGIFMFVRKLYELKVPSVFDYIGLRFGGPMKGFITVIYALAMLMYMGLIIYAPALAFSRAASGLNIQLAILITGGICIVYTTLGGLKGVILIDTLQMLIMMSTGIAAVALGTERVGGIEEVWSIAQNGSRIQWTPWSADPTIRHSFWSCVVGGIVILWLLITNQAITQKFLALPSQGQVLISGMSYVFVLELFCCIYGITGIIIYAYYSKIGCEPTQSGQLETSDQLFPNFVLDVFSPYGGFSGLFIASVFGASLSTVSAGINALAALTVRDIVYPMQKKKTGAAAVRPVRGVVIFKALTVFWGLVSLGIAFLAPLMGDSVLQIGISLLSMSSGPLVGVVISGMYIPFSEKIGQFVGVVCALIFELALLIGSTVYALKPDTLPLPPPDHCPVENVTLASQTWASTTTPGLMYTTTTPAPEDEANAFFKISYLLYAPFGILITIGVGMFTSAIVRCVQGDCYMRCPEVDRKLLCLWCVPKGQRSQGEEEQAEDIKVKVEHDEQMTEKPTSNSNGLTHMESKLEDPLKVEDVSPVLNQTNDLAVAASVAFAYDNSAYL